MKLYTRLLLFICLTSGLISCELEDPGPIQEVTRDFTTVDFDRLEMGSAFRIEVEQGPFYRIEAEGDRRNLDDLLIYKNGTTLIIRYDEYSNRRHETRIRITMPQLAGVNFSGASHSEIHGFEGEQLDVVVSGASVAQIEAGYASLQVNLSGASSLVLNGLGDELVANLSGASLLRAMEYPVGTATLELSGASEGKVFVADKLSVTATGASVLTYKGSPTVTSSVSGGSTVVQD